MLMIVTQPEDLEVIRSWLRWGSYVLGAERPWHRVLATGNLIHMDANVVLISPHEAADRLGLTIHRVRQMYGTENRLTKYVNKTTGKVRLDLAEVQALRARMSTFEAVNARKSA